MKQTTHARTTSSSHRNRQALERRRFKAARLFTKGFSQSEVARKFSVSCEAARKWHDAWQQEGISGLKSQGKPGPKPKLTEKKLEKVEQALLKGATAFGYTTDIWTLNRIAQVIKKVVQVSHHPGHIWHILRALNWSCQKPETKAPERNEKAIESWKQYKWPRIKKKQSEIGQF